MKNNQSNQMNILLTCVTKSRNSVQLTFCCWWFGLSDCLFFKQNSTLKQLDARNWPYLMIHPANFEFVCILFGNFTSISHKFVHAWTLGIENFHARSRWPMLIIGKFTVICCWRDNINCKHECCPTYLLLLWKVLVVELKVVWGNWLRPLHNEVLYFFRIRSSRDSFLKRQMVVFQFMFSHNFLFEYKIFSWLYNGINF